MLFECSENEIEERLMESKSRREDRQKSAKGEKRFVKGLVKRVSILRPFKTSLNSAWDKSEKSHDSYSCPLDG